MTDIGIEKGDLILVKKACTISDGEVVVALTEDGNTLKRLFWEDRRHDFMQIIKNISQKIGISTPRH